MLMLTYGKKLTLEQNEKFSDGRCILIADIDTTKEQNNLVSRPLNSSLSSSYCSSQPKLVVVFLSHLE